MPAVFRLSASAMSAGAVSPTTINHQFYWRRRRRRSRRSRRRRQASQNAKHSVPKKKSDKSMRRCLFAASWCSGATGSRSMLCAATLWRQTLLAADGTFERDATVAADTQHTTCLLFVLLLWTWLLCESHALRRHELHVLNNTHSESDSQTRNTSGFYYIVETWLYMFGSINNIN